MAFTFVQSAASTLLQGSTSIALTGVGAGNLILIWLKWEGSTGSNPASVSDGTSSLTMGTLVTHGNGDLHGQFAYLLSANSGSKTYTVTWPTNHDWEKIIVFEFSLSAACTLDTQNTGSGTSTATASGTITTTGTDELVFGSYGEYSESTLSSRLINGSAETGSKTTTPFPGAWGWYRAFSSTFSGGGASVTLSASADWLCNVISFKIAGGGTPLFRVPSLTGLGSGGKFFHNPLA